MQFYSNFLFNACPLSSEKKQVKNTSFIRGCLYSETICRFFFSETFEVKVFLKCKKKLHLSI